MSKPYTVTFGGAAVSGSAVASDDAVGSGGSASLSVGSNPVAANSTFSGGQSPLAKPILKVTRSNHIGAKVIMARRASLKETIGERRGRPPMRRQKTESSDRRETSPSSTNQSYQNNNGVDSHPQSLSGGGGGGKKSNIIQTTSNTHSYVRRQDSYGSSVDGSSSTASNVVDTRQTIRKQLTFATTNNSSSPSSSDQQQNRHSSSSSFTGALTKADKKRMAKLKENMRELLELFTAVEQDDIGKVRSVLSHGYLDVNGENLEDLTLLDIATMLNHTEVAQLLLSHGAQENPRLSSTSARQKKLQSLQENAQKKLAEIRMNIKQSGSLPNKELERQESLWESRLHLIKKMKANFDSTSEPQPPQNPTLHVASPTSLLLALEPSPTAPPVVTRYMVEWSLSSDFTAIEGTVIVRDLRRSEITIPNLQTGHTYFVRVCAGNFKGYGPPASSHPPCATPSSWREVDQRISRRNGHLAAITELYHELKEMRESDLWHQVFPGTSSSAAGIGSGGGANGGAISGGASEFLAKKKKTSLRNLFSASTKFQKTLKKGVYLATVLYKDDKVLCTVDDNVPVISVCEDHPNNMMSDFNWLMKVSCAWEESSWLGFDDAKGASAVGEAVSFRCRLLEAATEMQTALGVTDLGRLHSRPITLGNTTIFLTTQYVGDAKAVQGLAVRWIQLGKLLRKHQTAMQTSSKPQTAYDTMVSSLVDQLNFYESTYIPLNQGLYLAYLKLHSSVKDISIVVPENLPSVLPFVYMRQNPHVSKEEWEWLRNIEICNGTTTSLGQQEQQSKQPSSAQLSFHWSLCSAARILLDDLEVEATEVETHRIYRLEVVEVHSDVSFLLLVPASADVVSAPSNQAAMMNTMVAAEEKRGCLTIPVAVFEMAHLCTYQPDFITLYCRISAFLDFYLLVIQQLSRQAFSNSETESCAEQMKLLTDFQSRLEEIWKVARWITDVTSTARDKNQSQTSCLSLSDLFAFTSCTTNSSTTSTASSRMIDDSSQKHSENTNRNSVHSDSSGTGSSSAAGISRPSLTATTRADGTREMAQQINGNGSDVGAVSASTSSSNNGGRVGGGNHSENSSEIGEDNSDVGYHSDQSIEKANREQLQSLMASSSGNNNHSAPEMMAMMAPISAPETVSPLDGPEGPSSSASTTPSGINLFPPTATTSSNVVSVLRREDRLPRPSSLDNPTYQPLPGMATTFGGKVQTTDSTSNLLQGHSGYNQAVTNSSTTLSSSKETTYVNLPKNTRIPSGYQLSHNKLSLIPATPNVPQPTPSPSSTMVGSMTFLKPAPVQKRFSAASLSGIPSTNPNPTDSKDAGPETLFTSQQRQQQYRSELSYKLDDGAPEAIRKEEDTTIRSAADVLDKQYRVTHHQKHPAHEYVNCSEMSPNSARLIQASTSTSTSPYRNRDGHYPNQVPTAEKNCSSSGHMSDTEVLTTSRVINNRQRTVTPSAGHYNSYNHQGSSQTLSRRNRNQSNHHSITSTNGGTGEEKVNLEDLSHIDKLYNQSTKQGSSSNSTSSSSQQQHHQIIRTPIPPISSTANSPHHQHHHRSTPSSSSSSSSSGLMNAASSNSSTTINPYQAMTKLPTTSPPPPLLSSHSSTLLQPPPPSSASSSTSAATSSSSSSSTISSSSSSSSSGSASSSTTMKPSSGPSSSSSIGRTFTDRSPLQAGVLRVYAAYNCGLARGTSVKLQVTPQTSTREIVALVVQQLNKAAAAKSKGSEAGPLSKAPPSYPPEEYPNFCLVAVIGARERCLRDDFPPLDLQNPWAKGKLFVRKRDDLLAALEYGNEAQV